MNSKFSLLGLFSSLVFIFSSGLAFADGKALFTNDWSIYELDLETNIPTLILDRNDFGISRLSDAKENPFDDSEILASEPVSHTNRPLHLFKNGILVQSYYIPREYGFDWDSKDTILFVHVASGHYLSRLNLRTREITRLEHDGGSNESIWSIYFDDDAVKFIMSSGAVGCGNCADVFYGSVLPNSISIEGTISYQPNWADSGPDISPDRTRIAYANYRAGGTFYIRVHNLVTGDDILLLANGRKPKWFSDTLLAYYNLSTSTAWTYDFSSGTFTDLGVNAFLSDVISSKNVAPNIIVSLSQYDFGFVEILESRSTTVSIINNGTGDLSVSDIHLNENGFINEDPSINIDVEFCISDPFPVTPDVIPPGGELHINVEYIPKKLYHWSTSYHTARAEIVIASDDQDEPEIKVELTGKGAADTNIDASALSFLEIAGMLYQAELISLSDNGNSGGNKLNSLTDVVLTAGSHIVEGNITEACESLWAAYKFTDGKAKPKDKVFGEGVAILNAEIETMMAEQGCSQLQ